MRKREIKEGTRVESQNGFFVGTIIKVEDDKSAHPNPKFHKKFTIQLDIQLDEPGSGSPPLSYRTLHDEHYNWKLSKSPKLPTKTVLSAAGAKAKRFASEEKNEPLKLDDLKVGARVLNIKTQETGVIVDVSRSRSNNGSFQLRWEKKIESAFLKPFQTTWIAVTPANLTLFSKLPQNEEKNPILMVKNIAEFVEEKNEPLTRADLVVGTPVKNHKTGLTGVICNILGEFTDNGGWLAHSFQTHMSDEISQWYKAPDDFDRFSKHVPPPCKPLYKKGDQVVFSTFSTLGGKNFTGTIERVWDRAKTYNISVTFYEVKEQSILGKNGKKRKIKNAKTRH